MTVVAKASAIATPCKKLMKFRLSIFRRGFNSSKCKTMAKMTTARIKLLRNKREVVVKQMRRDIALLLQSGQDATARIRVEHVIREQNMMAANEIIELFCELVVVRLPIIAKQRGCPADLKEGISSLIFAAPRSSDIPELLQIRDIFEKKYGKEFASAAMDLHPDCGVNRTLIEKLSVRTPSGEVKLKIMKEIAKEYQVEWDTTESETELLKAREELIEGPRTFVSATSLPVKPISVQVLESNGTTNRSSNDGESDAMHFKDMASAAQAAAESARKAAAAARAAAYLANRDSHQVTQTDGFNTTVGDFSSPISSNQHVIHSGNSTGLSMPNDPPLNSHNNIGHQSKLPGVINESQSFDRSHLSNKATGSPNLGGKEVYRRHSYNVPTAHSDMKFDDSDGLDSDMKFDDSDGMEEIDMESPSGGLHIPPNRPPPPVPPFRAYRPENGVAIDKSASHSDLIPRVHPKLPDYDSLAARFEALKFRRSSIE